MKGKIKQMNKTTGLCRALTVLCGFGLAGAMPAIGQTTPAKGSAENIFVNSQQGTSTDGDPVVGNAEGCTTCGTYDASSYDVTLQTGGTTTDKLAILLGNWCQATGADGFTNLTGQAPFLWDNASPAMATAYTFAAAGTLAKPVAFAPGQTLNIAGGGALTLSAAADGSYALPVVNLDLSAADKPAALTVTNAKAIASVEKLEVKKKFPAKADGSVLYANVSMPFAYAAEPAADVFASFVTYKGANRAANGTAGQTNWESVTGKNWAATLTAAEKEVTFASATSAGALAALQGGSSEAATLGYAYGVTAEKSAAWKAAHFGWNVVNSGSVFPKNVTFSDAAISVLQYLTPDGGYTTLSKTNEGFPLAPYTAYFVQATKESTTTTAQTRSESAESAGSFAEAVVELLAPDGTVCDRILATAGPARPGRNVPKMGVAQRNIYIEKEGMKCAATSEDGRFDVRVTGKELDMRLASVASGVSALWNGVPLRVGEAFAAADGTLQLTGVPTSSETIGTDQLRVWGTAGHIVIEGAASGAAYRVASTAGLPVAIGRLDGDYCRVPVAAAGVYIVTVAERTFKVMVK